MHAVQLGEGIKQGRGPDFVSLWPKGVVTGGENVQQRPGEGLVHVLWGSQANVQLLV